MSKPPAFQFYVADFLTGTARFTAEEVGAYIRLLCYQWDCGGIDEQDVPQLTGVSSEKLGRVLSKFTKNGSNLLKNKRLEVVRKDQLAYREKQKINGLKGGRPRNPTVSSGLSKKEPTDNPTANPNETSLPSTSSLPSSLTTTTKKKIATGKPSLYFSKLKEKFLEVVKDKGLEYYFEGKDGKLLKSIEGKLIFMVREKQQREPNEKEILDSWDYILRHTKMKFVLENFTIPIISSKWNEIVNDLKNVKPKLETVQGGQTFAKTEDPYA